MAPSVEFLRVVLFQVRNCSSLMKGVAVFQIQREKLFVCFLTPVLLLRTPGSG